MTSLDQDDDAMDITKEEPVSIDKSIPLKSYILCLVCNERVEINLRDFEENSELFGEKYLSLFWIFCGHMKVQVDTEEEFDFDSEPFIFCKKCCKQLIELNKVHRKLTSLTSLSSNFKRQKINKIIAGLSSKIVNSYDHHNNNNDDEDDDDETGNSFEFLVKTTRMKVQVIRKFIFDAFNVTVSVERLPISNIHAHPTTTTTTTNSDFDILYNPVKNETNSNNVEMENFDIDVSSPYTSLTDFEDDDDEEAEDEGHEVIELSDDDLSGDSDEFDDLLSSSDDDESDVDDDGDTTVISSKKANVKIKISKSKPSNPRSRGGEQSKRKSRKEKITRKPKKHRKASSSSAAAARSRVPKKKSTYVRKNKWVRKKADRTLPIKTRKMKDNTLVEYNAVTQMESDVDGVSKFMYGGRFPFQLSNDMYTCNTCNKYTCPLKKNILDHMRNQHCYIDRFSCGHCGKKFSRKFEMQQHEIKVHVVLDFPFLCEWCAKSFKTNRELLIHTKARHEPHAPSKFKCNFDNCGRNFSCNKLLLGHQRRVHTGEKPFKCDICQKGFALKEVMVRHQKQHNAFKPYLCGICGKSFSRITYVVRHEETVHNPNKPPRKKPTKKVNIPPSETSETSC